MDFLFLLLLLFPWHGRGKKAKKKNALSLPQFLSSGVECGYGLYDSHPPRLYHHQWWGCKYEIIELMFDFFLSFVWFLILQTSLRIVNSSLWKLVIPAASLCGHLLITPTRDGWELKPVPLSLLIVSATVKMVINTDTVVRGLNRIQRVRVIWKCGPLLDS